MLTKSKLKQIIKEEVAKAYSFNKPMNPEYKHGKFSFEEYMNLPGPKERLEYAHKKLSSLGAGSSRIAYELPGTGKVLKVALNKVGVYQNKAELDVALQVAKLNSSYLVVTKIYGHDNENEPTWLVSESVKDLDETSFEEATGVSFDDLNFFLEDMHENAEIFDIYPGNKFIESLYEAFSKTDLSPDDLIVLDHWGLTEDNRVVILDYGFTRDVADIYNNQVHGNKFVPYSKDIANDIDPMDESLEQGLAKGIAYMAYPFVKVKHSLTGISHLEILDVEDFEENPHILSKKDDDIKYLYDTYTDGKPHIVPKKIKIGVIGNNDRIKDIIRANVRVLPLDKLSGRLEIEARKGTELYSYITQYDTRTVVDLFDQINKLNKELNKEYMF